MLMGPKQIIKAHCTDKNIPWEPEYAKYEKAMEDRRDAEAEIRNAEREARGFAEGAKREEMIALSRARYGDLTGEIVFGFPGWKCRWDLLPESQQTPKTFTAPDGLQWKLLKDVECMFGTRISKGGQEVEDIDKMVEAGKKNTAAHELFHTGSGKARDYGGVVELEAGKAEEITWTREEEEQKREIEKAKKSEKSGEKDFLPSSFSPVTGPGPLSITGVNHISRETCDVERLASFYREVLGLAQIPRPDFGFGGAWFQLPGGGKSTTLHIIQRDPQKPSAAPGETLQDAADLLGAGCRAPERFIRRGHHLALTVQDIEAAKRGLTAHGIGYAVNAVPGTQVVQLFVYDPDGNGIEIGNFDVSR